MKEAEQGARIVVLLCSRGGHAIVTTGQFLKTLHGKGARFETETDMEDPKSARLYQL